MKTQVLYTIALCSFVIACTTEKQNGEIIPPLVNESDKFCVQAIPETKTSISGFSTSWEDGDALGVFHNESYDGSFELLNAENASFEGKLATDLLESNNWAAVYPYSAVASFNSYPLTSFSYLPEDPIVDKMVVNKNSQQIPLFKLSFIAGTVIGKNKNKHIVALLTDSGVVNVKVWDAQFTKYDKQISVKNDEGKKKIIERSWFTRGNKLLLCGIRRGDNFIPKIYKNGSGLSSPIILIDDNMNLIYSRADDMEEE